MSRMHWSALVVLMLGAAAIPGGTAGAQPGTAWLPAAPSLRAEPVAAWKWQEPPVSARPPLELNGLLEQTAAGAVGGAAGLVAVGVPAIAAGIAGRPRPSDAVLVTLFGGAFLTGTTYGVHYAGRRQNRAANPAATAAGVLAGAALVRATRVPLLSDSDEYRQPNLMLLVPPAAGAVAGFALTRRWRTPPAGAADPGGG
jgi:hypothetical protein